MAGPAIHWSPQAGRRYPQISSAGDVRVGRVDSKGTATTAPTPTLGRVFLAPPVANIFLVPPPEEG